MTGEKKTSGKRRGRVRAFLKSSAAVRVLICLAGAAILLAMFVVAIVSYPEAQGLVCAGILRGSGKTAVVALYSFVSIAVLRPLLTAFFLYVMGLGLPGAWLALLLDQSIRAGCATFLVRRMQPHIGHHMEKLGNAA